MIKCQNKSTFKSSIAAAAAFSIAVCHKCHMTTEKKISTIDNFSVVMNFNRKIGKFNKLFNKLIGLYLCGISFGQRKAIIARGGYRGQQDLCTPP